MLYYSTNQQSPKVSFKEATIKGQAPDKGLYFPERIRELPKDFIKNIDHYSKEEIAFRAIQPFVGDTIPTEVLQSIVAETINFNFPLVKITDSIFSLELFHGPTLAFKDVGARFMSRCLGYFVKDIKKPVTVLVATSGDTGGAVASGFYEIEGVDVVILYPSGKVSSVQELQLTTLGKNITAIEIDGNFDDCQQLVKQAFADEQLNQELFLTSANSINVARWLPQQFYYFFAYQQWTDKGRPPVVCVPSGNFGNICAGMVAHLTGLPVKHFVAAVNANDSVYKYLETGSYQSQQAVATISNAMDVGNPSNFIRILELFKHEYPQVKNVVSSFSITDEETRTTLKNIYSKYDYLLDPHGAVAFAGLEKYLQKHLNDKGMILETAHPVKFYDVVEPITGQKVETPETIKGILNKKKESVKLSPDYHSFKQFLLL
ncbi:threonine synthase [Segetibacter aerophilus]|uniref:Threonine synthase n=1 Tax=Segetibacter aerophilus TaxID=670293 RepID=A0A512BI29_9BACT|nr:threonine synthase [Segetibacter aerophilus]GEO11644.1 threonine synthase [Segetibacter aerophilus]